jgi:ribose 5-phosphate isomerase A
VFVTDGGHYILDCAFGAIDEPVALAGALAALPGVVDHGLFLGLASAAVIAGRDGVQILKPPV